MNNQTTPNTVTTSNRRNFLIEGVKTLGALALITPTASLISVDEAQALNTKYNDALEEILKGATPTAKLLVIKMPEIAENGNVVSITIDASPAQATGKIIKSLHIFATDNPWPYVADFEFTKLSGKASVTSRMRLARSQKVVAIAALSDGSFLLAETFVKVTIGGCGG